MMTDTTAGRDAGERFRLAFDPGANHSCKLVESPDGEWVSAAAYDALRAERDALRADAARLDWLAEEPPFDALGDMDVHEAAFVVADEAGREEATAKDYHKAMRRVIDAAMHRAATAPTTNTETTHD